MLNDFLLIFYEHTWIPAKKNYLRSPNLIDLHNFGCFWDGVTARVGWPGVVGVKRFVRSAEIPTGRLYVRRVIVKHKTTFNIQEKRSLFDATVWKCRPKNRKIISISPNRALPKTISHLRWVDWSSDRKLLRPSTSSSDHRSSHKNQWTAFSQLQAPPIIADLCDIIDR